MQSARELDTFPLSPHLKIRLRNAGLLTANDISDMKPSELSKETDLTLKEAVEVINTVFGKGSSSSSSHLGNMSLARTAMDILHQEQNSFGIVTFSERLDSIMGGGVPLGKITEFCGAPGVGKTQLCMQLSADVQIPTNVGGLGGEVVYIDTEGSFVIERFTDIAKSTIDHCRHISRQLSQSEDLEPLAHFTLEKVLLGLHYFRCHDSMELIATIHLLPQFLQKHNQIRLVVIDSVAFHFRHDFENLALRNRLLMTLAQNLTKLAVHHHLACVLTNQVTTKVEEGNMSHIIPALGETWSHVPAIRIMFFWEQGCRYAQLFKSSSHCNATVPFQVTMDGLRDVIKSHALVNEQTSGKE